MPPAPTHLDVVKLLAARGANVQARVLADVLTYDAGGGSYVGVEWRTALSVARKKRHTDVVQFLQSIGARDLSTPDESQSFKNRCQSLSAHDAANQDCGRRRTEDHGTDG